MENLGELTILRIPLAALQYAPNIRQKIAQERSAFQQHCLRLYRNYKPEELASLLIQLRSALQNPSYNFQAMLPGIKTPNEDILFYFAFLIPTLEQAHSILLSQPGPANS